FSVRATRFFISACSTVAMFREPFGRPLGFPDLPFANCVPFGGRPKPTSYGGLRSVPSVSSVMTSLRGCSIDLIEALASAGVHSLTARVCLPASNSGVDIKRIDLHPVTTTTGALGGDEGGTAAEETVQNNVATRGAVENGIGHEAYGLHSG